MAAVRPPAVAGAFYPAQSARLGSMLDGMRPADVSPVAALGLMVPHAGYVYSGAAALRTFASAVLPSRVILLGPNHTGRGVPLAAAVEDEWLTPLGKVPVDRALLDALVAAHRGVVADGRAHAAEHCLEVQVPMLLALRPDVRIAPLVVGTHDLGTLLDLGAALAAVVAAARDADGRAPLLVISSDMTHYESAAAARRKDELALARLAAIDPAGLHRTVLGEDISMCGMAPAVAALEALRRLGATRGETVVYTHSGVVTGDDREVVAYAGMVFVA